MQVVYERCCGLDVHQKSVTACVLLSAPDGTVTKKVRTFGTMTADLVALGDWLQSWEVTQVAMESTGIYWRPVFNILEEGRTVLLVNAQHIKATSTDYSHWKQGFVGDHCRSDRSSPCTVRSALPAA